MKIPSRLTSSQKTAARKLVFFHDLQRLGIRSINGISARPFGLIIGPTGIGKTFLVNRLAETQGLPLLAINIPNWIPRGASQKDQITFDQIKAFIAAHDQGIIMIDELNKLNSHHTSQAAWSSDIYTECLAFLDQDVRLDFMGLAGLVPKLRRNFMIVGVAAFQDEWIQSQATRSSVGFQQPSDESSREQHFEKLVRSQHLVPDELLFRFNDNLILIAPPTDEEFSERISDIRRFLKLPPLAPEPASVLAIAARESGKMMRWLEGYLSSCLGELSPRALARFATVSQTTTRQATENAALPPTNKPAITTALRDQCFDEYDKSLHELSRAARRLQVLLQAVVSADAFALGNTDILQIVSGIALAGQNLRTQLIMDQQASALDEFLNHLAHCSLRVGLCSHNDHERARLATAVKHTASEIVQALPLLLAHCGPSREARDIKKAAFELQYLADHARLTWNSSATSIGFGKCDYAYRKTISIHASQLANLHCREIEFGWRYRLDIDFHT